MLISLEHQLAFLAVPKTGSTAIEAALSPFCDIIFTKNPQIKHMTARRFHWHMRKYLRAIGHEKVEICAVIREPVDWLGSWYRYRQRPDMAARKNSTLGVTFDDFALAYMEEPRPKIADVGQQSVFLSLPDNAPPIDHIFAYENIDKFREFLSARMGKEFTFDRLNVSPTAPLELSKKTRAKLNEYFTEDTALWLKAQQQPSR